MKETANSLLEIVNTQKEKANSVLDFYFFLLENENVLLEKGKSLLGKDDFF